jgi:hypothetical protein
MPYDEHQLKRYEAILRQARVRALTKEELDFVKAFCQSYFQLLERVCPFGKAVAGAGAGRPGSGGRRRGRAFGCGARKRRER